jgi:two-component system OmpR family response regulator
MRPEFRSSPPSETDESDVRILVVEDEPDLRRVLYDALEEAGLAVDVAADGHAALHKALAWDYDAILLDLMLPGLSGWDVLTQLRQEKQTPVLVMTARDAVDDRVRALDQGADDYLIKPFALSELLARLRALVRRTTGGGTSVITLGEVQVNLASRTVLQGGVPVRLTATEFALVEYLALHRGRVVSQTELYERLFDEHHDSLSNLIEVHVANVRRKLGRDFIVTRRGQGYLIDAPLDPT